ncbi:polysaccharide biosynthesis C-terminal domain-containing protein [Leifsonia sp. McL0608]|uniref:polysaccharide biosynthesis C-terminal domain-containing protein n=1 Tax=Leifsonia sp. McL0608 TaxID=3143537 RepID=UPI0031F30B54
MTRISLTGANGFLGWHTRGAAHAQGISFAPIAVGDDFDLAAATDAISGTDRLIHIAGVNRASDPEVLEGNIRFAQQLASALDRATPAPSVVVFANSTQAGNGTTYGAAKQEAADILRGAAGRAGAEFVDLHLPNLFGEHGRPFYNSVVATFSHLLASGGNPEIDQDRELTLLHAQNAADALLGSVDDDALAALDARETVTGLLTRLREISSVYSRGGEIPDIAHPFDRDLFNTYRAAAFPNGTPIRLRRHADNRGSFFEIVRSHGGAGQSSFSTTVSGVTRGDHYHRRKVERFTVISGEATIKLRKLFSTEVFEFRLDGTSPASIDMPTMWAHNITNVGETDLYTSFWSNELFDSERPDTIAEPV